MKKHFIAILFWCFTHICHAQLVGTPQHRAWADSVLNILSIDEKIGQLIMPPAWTNRSPAFLDTVMQQVVQYKVGGFVFFQGGPIRHATMLNKLQAASKVPLIIALDGEWGLGMRLDSTVKFPYQMTLGAIQGQDSLIYRMGKEVAKQFLRQGLHINFAPVADINNNPNNPVINFRSFGENKYRVAEKAIAYMQGMQDQGLLTSAKHFPGHGDTDVDSHYDLPIIRHNRFRMDSLELYPFQQMIHKGLSGLMIAHLNIPALDSTKNLASTLSSKIVTDVARRDLGFKGLIFTDAMNMKGATKYFAPGIADVKALLAGNDIIEYPSDIAATIKAIKIAVLTKEFSEEELNARVHKVLLVKATLGLDNYRPVVMEDLVKDLNPTSSNLLNRQLTQASLTVLKNEKHILPIRKLEELQVATVAIFPSIQTLSRHEIFSGTDANISTNGFTAFQRMAENYLPIKHFRITATATTDEIQLLLDSLKSYNLVLVGVHGLSVRPANNFGGLTANYSDIVKKIVNQSPSIVSLFANAYSLNKLQGIENAKAIVLTYQENAYTQEMAAQLIFGAVGATGKLPVTVNENYSYGAGIAIQPLGRFAYTIPEELGFNGLRLADRIDSLANTGITQKAYPGCVILVAKDGKIIYQKAYGNQVYNGKLLKISDLYDFASVTKISTSAAALMKLADEGKFKLDTTFQTYFPKWKKTNKATLVFRDILTHQAGLKAWIPFWKDCIDSTTMEWKRKTFSYTFSNKYPIQVADNLYLHRKYSKKIYKAIAESIVSDRKQYVYSDLSYYLYPEMLERITGQKWQDFLDKNFYKKLGAGTLTYNPRQKFSLEQIVPTEYDSLYRKTLIHGRVHDEGASMLNGVSGHAGLFGTANDLAKLMQMYLNKGSYGGEHYISEATINEWTRYNDVSFSRRGIAFDKPDPKRAGLSAARSASPESFGHSGFTGTFAWADPATGLLYIFLSNRVYPTRNNTKISDLNIRTNLGEILYQELAKIKK